MNSVTPIAQRLSPIAMVLAGLVVMATGPRVEAGPRAQCWTSAELASRPAEGAITKSVAEAYRPVPEGRLTMARPVPHAPGQVVRRVKLPAGQKVVALTFDLCEQPSEVAGYQGGIVDVLRQKGVAATFFAGGKWLETHPERAQQILGDPLFEIGNHAWEHRNFQILTPEAMHTEVGAAQIAYGRTYDALEARQCLDRTGARPAHTNAEPVQRLFRFPFGACNAEAIRTVESYGLTAIQWDVSSADPWQGQTVEAMEQAVLRHVRPGSIVLFHANGRGWRTQDAIPRIVEKLAEQGYTFARVSDLMSLPGAEPELSPLCYDFRLKDVDRYQDLARKLERSYDAFYARLGKSRPVLAARPTRAVQ